MRYGAECQFLRKANRTTVSRQQHRACQGRRAGSSPNQGLCLSKCRAISDLKVATTSHRPTPIRTSCSSLGFTRPKRAQPAPLRQHHDEDHGDESQVFDHRIEPGRFEFRRRLVLGVSRLRRRLRTVLLRLQCRRRLVLGVALMRGRLRIFTAPEQGTSQRGKRWRANQENDCADFQPRGKARGRHSVLRSRRCLGRVLHRSVLSRCLRGIASSSTVDAARLDYS